jgi:arginine exporter protein ArgO
VPGVTEEVLIGLILLMSLLHTIAFAAATLGVFSMLTWPRRLWFSVTLFGGVMLGLYATGVVQDLRAQAAHQPPPPITTPGQRL